MIWSGILGIIGLVLLGNSQIVGGVVCIAIVAAIVYFRPKMSYHLMVRSAGADTSVLNSRDSAYLGQVKAAIEEAVRQRG